MVPILAKMNVAAVRCPLDIYDAFMLELYADGQEVSRWSVACVSIRDFLRV